MSTLSLAKCIALVADLRKEPVPASKSVSTQKDLLQESQILKNEVVRIISSKGEWAYVEAMEQKKWWKILGWTGYPGWVEFCKLETGKKLKWKEYPPPHESARDKILSAAPDFLDKPYLWGGRSRYNPALRWQNTGVDCSGYINLIYGDAGVDTPRDACDQHRMAKMIEPQQLKPADVVFLSDGNKVYHVMLYMGGDELYESTIISGSVRKITFEERFGTPLRRLQAKQTVEGGVIEFGTFFHS